MQKPGPGLGGQVPGVDPPKCSIKSLLPLPSVAVESLAAKGLSRGTRQRVARRVAVQKEANETIRALNSMCGAPCNQTSADPCPEHPVLLGRIQAAVSDRMEAEFAVSAQEARETLLQLPAGYEALNQGESVGLAKTAPYVPGNVSLPDNVDDSPVISELCRGEPLRYLQQGESSMLRSAPELEKQEILDGPARCYVDPVLAADQAKYLDFVRDLARRGLLGFCSKPRSKVGVFFVKKKSGQLRLVIDARPANRVFDLPPGVSLASSESFSKLECGDGEEVYVGTVDVQDCFHRLKMPDWMRPYFCLPPVRTGDVGISSLDGIELEAWQEIFPCCLCLPMGFTWSLYFAQNINQDIVSDVNSLQSSSPITDKSPGTVVTDKKVDFSCMLTTLVF